MSTMRTMAALLALWPLAALAADPHPEGTRIATMVVRVATLEDIFSVPGQDVLAQLRKGGITDAELTDGSVAAGIVYCCGGKISRQTMLMFYVPPEFRVAVGDVTEISLGRVPTKKQRKSGDSGTINRALRVRESFEDDSGMCRWDPENDTLWMRVLYCDWMLGEGWQYRGGLSKGWYKPPGG